MDANTHSTERLRLFAEAGMEMAIDDFGTGYSSLAYIRKYDVDYIKINRSFIIDITPDSDVLSLCETIIIMSYRLGIKVITEGVET